MSNQQMILPLAVGVGIGALVATASSNPTMGIAAGSLAFAGAFALGSASIVPQAISASHEKPDKKKKGGQKKREEPESEEEEAPKSAKKPSKPAPRSPSPESPKQAKPEKKEPKKSAPQPPPKKAEAPRATPAASAAKKVPVPSPPAAAKAAVPPKSPPQKAPSQPQPQANKQNQQQELSKSAQKRAKQKKKEETEKAAKDAELMAAMQRKRQEDDEKAKQQAALEAAITAQKEGWQTQATRKPPKKEKKEKPAKKSSDGGEAEPAAPRSRTGKIVVDAKHHGRLIGPQGAIKRAIESVTNTEINMPKLGGGNTITIEGDPDRIDKAKEIIEDIVKKGFSPEIIKNGETQMAMELPDEKGVEGRIYGTKGVNLQAIQKKLKVRIAMPERNATDRKLTIIGTPVQCERARECIQQLIAENYSSVTHEGWTKLEFDIPREDLPLLIGKKGTVIQTIQEKTGAKLNIPGEHDMNQHVVVVGPPEAVTKAEKEIMDVLQPDENEEETAVDTAWAEGIQEIAF